MSKYEEHTALVRRKCIKDIETLDDGYKCWCSAPAASPRSWSAARSASPGCSVSDTPRSWSAARYLDELNKDWDEEVNKL